jgi:hypothetical protein
MQIGKIVTIKGICHIGRVIAPKHLHPTKAWIIEWEDGTTTWELEADLLPIQTDQDCQSE